LAHAPNQTGATAITNALVNPTSHTSYEPDYARPFTKRVLADYLTAPEVAPVLNLVLTEISEQAATLYFDGKTDQADRLIKLLSHHPSQVCAPALRRIANSRTRRGTFGQILKTCEQAVS